MKLKAMIGLTLLIALTASIALGDWKVAEETNIEGMVSGIVKQGTIFKTLTGSIYEVSDVTIQAVALAMPKVLVLQDGQQFKLVIDGVGDPLICRQIAPPKTPSPNQRAPLQEILVGQEQRIPNMTIDQLIPKEQQKELGIQKLTAQEKDKLSYLFVAVYARGVEDGKKLAKAPPVQVQPQLNTPATIDSQIDGTFDGWNGDTIIRLTNGQIWQQAVYHYHYHYAYRPKVLIYQSSGVYKIKVTGDEDDAVVVKRLR